MFNQCFMPSDIARLTYGYLLETNCVRTAQMFLEESPYLGEFAQGIKNGYHYSVKPYNMSLIETLNGKFSQTNHNAMTGFSNTRSNPNDVRNAIHESHLSTPKHKVLASRNLNAYSPRRKSATPKRLPSNQQSSQRQQQQQQLYCHSSDPIQQLIANSSPISSMACESSEIDIEVQPQIIFNELLKYRPLQDKVANTIQKIIDVKDNSDDVATNQPQQPNIESSEEMKNCETTTNSNKIGDIEKDLLPADTMDELLSSLAEEPEFQNFMHLVVEKEIANTPYKSLFNPPSNTSNSSLNTPNVFMTPVNSEQNEKMKNSSQVMPVKNLMNEMKTPERGSIASSKLNANNNRSSTTNNASKIKPILQNPIFMPKFSRINHKQKEVYDAMKISTGDNRNVTNKQPLTTTITMADDDDDQLKSFTGDGQNQKPATTTTTTAATTMNNEVKVVSVQNWSTPNTNALIIPNNQTLNWNDQQSLVYLSYPTTTNAAAETIYFIDSSNIVNPTITTCNNDAVTTDTKPMTTIVDNQLINENIVSESNQQSEPNTGIRSPRTVPSILS
ncbi:hypothetical protein BLA29_000769, partial [Euroglyphus maynei]